MDDTKPLASLIEAATFRRTKYQNNDPPVEVKPQRPSEALGLKKSVDKGSGSRHRGITAGSTLISNSDLTISGARPPERHWVPAEIANRHLSNRFGALNHSVFHEFDPCLKL